MIQIQVLKETRELELNQEPFSGKSQNVQTERMEDKWVVPITVPSGFKETSEMYVASVPQRILTCPSCGGKGEPTCSQCNGSGLWICEKCQGRSTVPCNACNGTGKYQNKFMDYGPTGSYSERKKCEFCQGDGALPCVPCKGVALKTCMTCRGNKIVQCETCASSGQVAEVPRIAAKFTPIIITKQVCEESIFAGDLSGESGITVFNETTTIRELPWSLDEFPLEVVRQIRSAWKSVVHDSEGKIHRIQLKTDYVPCSTVLMRRNDDQFSFYIVGTTNQVSSSANIPIDSAYLKQKRINELHENIFNCQEKLTAAKILSTLFFLSTILLIAFAIWLWLFAEEANPVPLPLVIWAAIFCAGSSGIKLFSNSPKPGLLGLLSKLKRLKQELVLEEQGGFNS